MSSETNWEYGPDLEADSLGEQILNPQYPETASECALELDPEEIARVAYGLWQAGGCHAGTAERDWFRAEALLRAELGVAEERPAEMFRAAAGI